VFLLCFVFLLSVGWLQNQLPTQYYTALVITTPNFLCKLFSFFGSFTASSNIVPKPLNLCLALEIASFWICVDFYYLGFKDFQILMNA